MSDATVEDVRDSYEGTLDALRTQVELDKASRVLRAVLRRRGIDLDAWIASGRLDPEDVKIVVVRMVLRVLRNPAGYKNEQAGDYGYSVDTAVSSGRLFLTQDDLDLLGLPSGGKVGTIKVGSAFRRTSLVLDAET